ncbi:MULTISPECIES: hypothetical protein [unclassified Streptomyces]|uniref:hypothetical protein n=1 Tax=unclassified Streptomyces TaxID=2593676 RepID=UPI0009A0EE4E|nr:MULTISPECIES: hypothetical protein [unclassified Streptomyces]
MTTEPVRWPAPPVQLPLGMEPEPVPVQGCAGCTELAELRRRARTGGDMTTVSDCNVLLRRHPEGH